MPTSDANLTGNQIIRHALADLGNTNPSNNEIADAWVRLNEIVKEVDTEARWPTSISQTESQITLVAGQSSYATGVGASNIATNILRLEKFFYLSSANQHEPVDIVDQKYAMSTYLKDTSGKPICVFLEVGALMTSNKLWVYPTPAAAYSCRYHFQRRIYDFDQAGTNPDLPQGSARYLRYLLAADLCPSYGKADQQRATFETLADIHLKKRLQASDQQTKQPRQRSEYF